MNILLCKFTSLIIVFKAIWNIWKVKLSSKVKFNINRIKRIKSIKTLKPNFFFLKEFKQKKKEYFSPYSTYLVFIQFCNGWL